MVECDPGDLDPHAVASIFKTYLREREYLLTADPAQVDLTAVL